MKRRISISVILSLVLLITSITLSVTLKASTPQLSTTTSHSLTTDNETAEEMRGLWVSYLSLDMQESDKTVDTFVKKFRDIIEQAIKYKCNTLIVQVRPFCDALYNSSYFPYSHILSGTQGVSPDYDALEYMCKAAHENNLKIHAWVNPLRIATSYSTFTLAENNPYIENPNIAFKTESGIYLNPANADARELIINGIKEIAENYEVDGIQFDDYFYPSEIADEDENEYNTYKASVKDSNRLLSVSQWRENNINLLISEVYRTIKTADENVLFGISPQGNLDNNKSLYANPTLWCETQGYIDYICPQLYFSISNPTLSFQQALNDWRAITYHKNIKVYIGLAVYKAGTEEDNSTWALSDTILKDELLLLREYKFDGFMLYEYRSLKEENAQKELLNFSDSI